MDTPPAAASTELTSQPFASSPSITKLAEALASAQAEFPDIERDKTADTGKYKYDYADLATVIKRVRPFLTRHGLSVLQPPTVEQRGQVVIKTILLHKSGEWICEQLAVPVMDTGDPQKLGSAISYGRRYAYCGVVGVATQGEDDDARAARLGKRRRPEEEEPSGDVSADTRPITTKNRDGSPGGQLGRLRAIMREHGVDEKDFGMVVRESYGYRRWSDIERRNYDAIVALAENWKAVDVAATPADASGEA